MTVSVPVHGGLRASRGVRIAAISGILWPVLATVRLFLTGELDRPDWTGSQSSILDFYQSSSFDAVFAAGIGLVALGYLLQLVFISKVSALIETDENGAPWLGKSVLSVAIVGVGFTMGYLATFTAAVFWSSHGGLGVDGYLALHGLSYASYGLALVTDVLLGALFGGAIVVTRLFPRWLGWAMILTGVAEGVAWFLSPDVWNATSGLPYLWVLIAALIMLTRPGKYRLTCNPRTK